MEPARYLRRDGDHLDLTRWSFDTWMAREERVLSRQWYPYTWRARYGISVRRAVYTRELG